MTAQKEGRLGGRGGDERVAGQRRQAMEQSGRLRKEVELVVAVSLFARERVPELGAGEDEGGNDEAVA